jgi:hypothetical protein
MSSRVRPATRKGARVNQIKYRTRATTESSRAETTRRVALIANSSAVAIMVSGTLQAAVPIGVGSVCYEMAIELGAIVPPNGPTLPKRDLGSID